MLEQESVITEFSLLLPPDPHLEVSFVMPINGSCEKVFLLLLDLLHQSALQTQEDIRKVELVFMVNNTKQACALQTEEYQQNQQLLQIVQYIQQDIPLTFLLSNRQRNILEEVKRKHLSVHAINHSSNAYAPIRKDISHERITASQNIVLRSKYTIAKDALLLWLIDDDVRLFPGDLEVAQRAFIERDLDMLDILIDYFPGEGTAYLYQTHDLYRYHSALQTCARLLWRKRATYWKIMRIGAFKENDPISDDGPIWLDMMHAREGKKHFVSPWIRMHTEDRARPSTIGGQLGARRNEQSIKQENIEHMAMQEIRLLIQKVFVAIQIAAPHDIAKGQEILSTQALTIQDSTLQLEQLITLLLNDEERALLTVIINQTMQQENIRHTVIRSVATNLVHQLFQGYLPHPDSQKAIFLKQNPWILSLVQEVQQQDTTIDKAFAHMQKLFPDIFGDMPKTAAVAVAHLMALNKFIAHRLQAPVNSPMLSSFLAIASSSS